MSRFRSIIFYLFSTYLFLTPLLPLKVMVLNRPIPTADLLLLTIFMLYFIYLTGFKENRGKFWNNLKAFFCDKFNVALMILFAAMTISIFYAKDRGIAISETFRLGSFAALVYIIQTEYRSSERHLKILKVCLASAAVVACFGIYQYFTNYNLNPEFIYSDTNTKRITSTLDNPNTLAAYLILFLFPVIILAAKVKDLKYKFLYAAMALIFAVNIFFTGSRSVFLGGVAALAVLVFLVSWKYIWVLGSLSLMSLLFKPLNSRIFSIFDASLNSSRVKLWAAGLKMIQNNPIFGVGNGNYVTNYNDYVDRYPHLRYQDYRDFPSHNSYIKVWSELGILGILAFISLVVLSVKKVYDCIKDCRDNWLKAFYTGFLCSLCGFYVMNFFDNLLFVPKVALYFWTFISVRKIK
ncbi:O-antigen ligase family protein [Clostridium thermarum]|uniref:O-antigen ligase family protein n=2 Tax=Clostridium thermarum TaxID=1716543 RepID=UPI001122DBBC|nr:O-antigen ligase family protein [Clostridium thermarum]